MEPTRRAEIKHEILHFLNQKQIRATYTAVGGLLGLPARSVGKYLGKRRVQASWVVSKKTEMPAGYKPPEIHPALKRNPEVIDTAEELGRRMELATRR